MNWKKRKKLRNLAKKHGFIHGYQYIQFVHDRLGLRRYYCVTEIFDRNGRVYSPESLSAAIADFKKHHKQLIKKGKWQGELNHPTSTGIDLTNNPDVCYVTRSKIRISGNGEVNH